MEIGKPKIVTEEALDAALAYIKDKVGNNSMLIVEQTETTASINPGVLNRWGVVANLSIDFTPPILKCYAAEYCIEFVSGETPTTLSLPSDVQFPDEPVIEANMRYQISVMNNIGLMVGVPFEYGDAELASPATPIGIAVLLKNGKKIDYAKMSPTSHFPKSVVEGIAFECDGHSLLIAPEATQCYFCNGSSVCPTVASGLMNQAAFLFDGKDNTEKYHASLTNPAWAVNVAYGMELNGTRCWLPSLGELKAIFNHRDTISELLQKCGLEGLTKGNYWSSSLANRVDSDRQKTDDVNGYLYTVYGVYVNGNADGFNVQGLYWALPITDLKD